MIESVVESKKHKASSSILKYIRETRDIVFLYFVQKIQNFVKLNFKNKELFENNFKLLVTQINYLALGGHSNKYHFSSQKYDGN